ncbi:hypoxanthine phosphoribosyltransferase [bacterium]|nr:hypoxanthine phosphoribosyltransferase [bacterium]
MSFQGLDVKEIVIDHETLSVRIREMAMQIKQDYQGKRLKLICILKGAVFFMVELAKSLSDVSLTMDFMDVTSYGASTTSCGEVRILKDLDEPIENDDVLLIEDIVDSGLTLRFILKQLAGRNPASLKICTLLDKPSRRLVEVPIDYCGFAIPDSFVVGYGLDFDQRYRNLPFIAALDESKLPPE